MKKIKKFWNLKAFILSFLFAFIFCFFTGIFWNYTRLETYTAERSYYINRGFPTPWSGVSKLDKEVDLPIVKMPFLTKTLFIDSSQWSKIIDLSIFIPLFSLILIITYPVSFIFAKAAQENTNLNLFLYPAFFLLLALSIFLYFYWFPRI